MNYKPLAVLFSDHHLANWQQHNEDGKRVHNSGYVPLVTIFNHANDLSVPVIFAGDLIDHPKRVDNLVLQTLSKAYMDLNTEMIGINGNHDIYLQSSYAHTSPGYLTTLATFCRRITCIDNTYKDTDKLRVHGIPYFHGDEGFLESLQDRINEIEKGKINILVIHRDLAGAVEPTGAILPKDTEQDKPMKRLFKNFDLVVSGHIHKAQEIKALGSHVYMLGATNQQRRSDANTECGYWVLYKSSKGLSMKFFPLGAPEFRYYTQDEGKTDDFHYWIKLPEETELGDSNVDSSAFSVENNREDMVDAYFQAKGINDKRKRKVALKYLN